MNALLPNLSPYLTKKLIAVYLCGYLLAAYFSVGFHHLDEHFQILEFALYKLGFDVNLPWEFAAQIRPALQPTVVFLLYRFMEGVGGVLGLQAVNTFFLALWLRLFTLALHTLVLLILNEVFIKEVKPQYRRTLVWLSIIIWFFPYVAVRFSSENISRILFLLSLTIPLWWEHLRRLHHYSGQTGVVGSSNRFKSLKSINTWIYVSFIKLPENSIWAVSGVLSGMAFFARFQVGILVGVMVLWLWFFKKSRWTLLTSFIVSMCITIGVNVFIDTWFYGNWVFTPYEYLKVNLIEGKVNSFGVSPWYQYINLIGQYNFLFFPLYVIIPFVFLGLYPRHIFSILIVAFSLVHFAIGHKELRFLYPLISFLPWIWMLSWQKLVDMSKWLNRHENGLLINILKKYFWIFHILFWLIMIIKPADFPTKYFYEHIYRSYPSSDIMQFSDESSSLPLSLPFWQLNFYIHPDTTLFPEIKNFDELNSTFKKVKKQSRKKNIIMVNYAWPDEQLWKKLEVPSPVHVGSFPFKNIHKYPQFYDFWVKQAKLRVFHIFLWKPMDLQN